MCNIQFWHVFTHCARTAFTFFNEPPKASAGPGACTNPNAAAAVTPAALEMKERRSSDMHNSVDEVDDTVAGANALAALIDRAMDRIESFTIVSRFCWDTSNGSIALYSVVALE